MEDKAEVVIIRKESESLEHFGPYKAGKLTPDGSGCNGPKEGGKGTALSDAVSGPVCSPDPRRVRGLVKKSQREGNQVGRGTRLKQSIVDMLSSQHVESLAQVKRYLESSKAGIGGLAD